MYFEGKELINNLIPKREAKKSIPVWGSMLNWTSILKMRR